MKTKIIDGKKISEEILARLREKIKGSDLKLAAVLVGENSASRSFLKQKEKACEELGVGFKLYQFSANVSNEKLENNIKTIGEKDEISGLIVQLPLPGDLKTQKILDSIPPGKDIDVLSLVKLGEFYCSNEIAPPIVRAIEYLFERYQIDIKRERFVVVGGGKLVGKPLAVWLLSQQATFSVVNKFTENISGLTKKADILISGVGKPNLIGKDMIKEDALIVDCGFSKVEGQIKGDVNLDSVSGKASFVTPVPGGMGPLVVSMVLRNLVKFEFNSEFSLPN